MAATAKLVVLALSGAVSVQALPGVSPYAQAAPKDKTGRVLVAVDRQRLADGRSNVAAYKTMIDKVIKETGAKNVARQDDWGVFGMDAKDAPLLKKVLGHPLVLFAEDSHVVRPSKVETVRDATKELWGIDRIDTRTRAYDGKASYTGNGEDVDVYVIDTGINVDHQELKGRAQHFWTAFTNTTTPAAQDPWKGGFLYPDAKGFYADDNGHGSHCAGTIAGEKSGVAPKANVHNAKVFLGGASTSDEIILTAMGAVKAKRNTKRRTVISMSLGGTKGSNLYSEIINDLVMENIVVVVAAGNDNQDACTKSPAFSPKAITVGASDINDAIATFSNWGTCVDVFAPGVNIYSAWYTGPAAYNTISGTSMACPHVAGATAVLLSQYPSMTATEVHDVITGVATEGVVKNVPVCPQSPNKLLYTRFNAEHLFFAKPGSGATDAYCQANVSDREKCEIRPQTGCLATAKGRATGVTDAWCKEVHCAADYSDLCQM